MDLSEKKILLVGAGRIAGRRLQSLLAFGLQVKVVAKDLRADFLRFADSGVIIEQRCFAKADMDDADMVLACTDDPLLNKEIAEMAKERGILYNSCSDKRDCNIYFPSLIVTQELCIALGTDGKNPAEVKRRRQQIEKALSLQNIIRYTEE